MLNVLMIYDELERPEKAVLILAENGHNVRNATTSNYLEALRARHFDVVITNVFMFPKSALAVIEDIRSVSPGTRIVSIQCCAKYGLESLAECAVTLGADAALVEPVTAELLAAALETGSFLAAQASSPLKTHSSH